MSEVGFSIDFAVSMRTVCGLCDASAGGNERPLSARISIL